ncbi:hypothetical protein A3768_1203 [Ralstonia solanacearum]|nr:hypothetical protein F504_2304 [Ralstonia pseudosolanacearum FQY_4]ANH32367.1 hypothetical protein A3768_1203 [Ralstonia solanacearum]
MRLCPFSAPAPQASGRPDRTATAFCASRAAAPSRLPTGLTRSARRQPPGRRR